MRLGALPVALLAATLAICAAGPSRARADVPSDLAGRRVVAVEIEGAPLAASEVGIEPGTPLGRRMIREAIQRLLASGRWVDVQIDAERRDDGVALRVRLAPRILITRIEIAGNALLDDPTIRQIMRVHESGEIEAGGLDALEELVASAYAERGYSRAEIAAHLRDTDDVSRKVLLIEVTEGEPLHLRGIQFEGDAPPESADAASALGIGIGDVLDRRQLEDGVRAVQARLRERGWLESRVGDPAMQPAEGGLVLVLPLHLGRHWRVLIRGHEPLEVGAVAAVLALSEEPLTGAVALAIRERVLELYHRHGFDRAEVRVERTRDPERADEPRAARMLIDIEPGIQRQVVGVSFPGASHFEPSFLRDQLNSYLEEDLPHPDVFYPVDSEVIDRLGLSGRTPPATREIPIEVEVIPERTWYPPTYDEAVVHMRELYQAAGYLRAEVGPAELRELDGERGFVTIPVFEGPRTLIYDVRVRGNDVLSTAALLEAARLARGDAFGYLPLEEARRRVLERYADEGHLFARVDPTVRFSPDRERAEIVLEIIERFPVRVGEIRIEGAELTDEGLIRDVVTLRSGELYRPSVAHETEDRLLALGIFGTVSVAPADPDLPERTKPVVVTVAERTSQAVGLSGGIGSGEGARGAFEYGYRNLLGLAIGLNIRAQLAYQFIFQDTELAEAITQLSLLDRVERRVTAGISLPWLPGLPNVRASIDLAHVRDNERDFGYDKNGVALTLAWIPERRITFSLSGEVEHNNVQLFGRTETLRQLIAMAVANGDTRTQRLLRVPEGESAIGSTRLSWSWDLRDSPFTPTEGIYVSVIAEYAQTIASEQLPPATPGGPLPDPFHSNFVKLNATLSGYIPIATGWVLALQGRFGRIFHLEPTSQTYPNRAYYMGGNDTLRGFLQDQVIPEDLAQAIRALPAEGLNPIRTGDVFYLMRVELRFPLVGDLYGGVFADVGNVWAVAEAFDFLVPRWNAGLGLRIATPIGPIALDYGFNLDRRLDLDEPFGSLHFSIGLF